MKKTSNILISGIGGVGGVNFAHALTYTGKYRVFGSDHFKYHHIFPDAIKVYHSPKHSSSTFIATLENIIKRQDIDFLHCFPTLEAMQAALFGVSCKTLLPNFQAMNLAFDKYESTKKLGEKGVNTPELYDYSVILKSRLGEKKDLKFPIWVRARRGAGGAKSICCFDFTDIEAWLHIWSHRGTALGDFVFQEYVEGKDIAFDSLWVDGKLITSFSRERIEYPPRGLGKGGSPVVAKTIHDKSVNTTGISAVKALDERPNGFYCVDMIKTGLEDVYVTEVNAGKAHTTLPLWGLAMQKTFGRLELNLAYVYTELGLGNSILPEISKKTDLYPEDYFLIRETDCGSWIFHEKNGSLRIVT